MEEESNGLQTLNSAIIAWQLVHTTYFKAS